jgi:hypothetical protein
VEAGALGDELDLAGGIGIGCGRAAILALFPTGRRSLSEKGHNGR